jgi:hypothetical protein
MSPTSNRCPCQVIPNESSLRPHDTASAFALSRPAADYQFGSPPASSAVPCSLPVKMGIKEN